MKGIKSKRGTEKSSSRKRKAPDTDAARQKQDAAPPCSSCHEPTSPEWTEAEPGAWSDDGIVPVSVEGTECRSECDASSADPILDPPSLPASAPSPSAGPTPSAPSPSAGSTPSPSTTQSSTTQWSVLGKRKKVPSKDLDAVSVLNEEEELNRAQREQHFRRLFDDAREAREEQAALRKEEAALCREEAALRREEVSQNASFDQAFLGVLGEIARAMAQRHA